VPIGQRELLSARLIAATFGLVFAFAVAVLGQWCRGPVTGLVAGSIVAVHPLAVHAYTHALVDIIALAFSVLAVLGLIALLPSPLASFKIARAGADLRVRPGADTSVSPYHGILKPAVVTGLFLALAVGSKMNALIVVMVAAALFLVLAARASGLQARRLQIPDLAPVLALAVGLLLFIAMNPSLYSDVPGGLRDLIAVPARTTRLQASFLPDYLPTASARLGTVAILLCGYQIGLLFLVALAIRPTWLAMRCLSARSVVVLWWWIALLAVTAWIPFPWPRYALPLLPPAAVLIADAVVESLHAVASPT